VSGGLEHSDWLLTPERAAVHRPTATAVIADLHLGYGQVRRRSGEAVPALGLTETIAALQPLVARERIRRLVIAGDLLENSRCPGPATELQDWLARAGVELAAVIPGNHDRGLEGTAAGFSLQAEGIVLGGWRVVHGDSNLPRGRVIHGHIHPCLRLGGKVSAPCFLVAARTLILPAFSPDAAGVNVLKDPRWQTFHCCVPVGDRVLDFGEVGLLRKKWERRTLKKGSGEW
jgi:putative SbcD/Mre11-related phosphoesterase